MSSILMVPIHLDAKHLRNDCFVVDAIADFTRLPYVDQGRELNPDVANISEEIVSKPFQNQNLRLKAGIHLHWALPDALTKGKHTERGTDFPSVPNRWLVTRSRQGEIEQQWVIESDYIYPDSQGSQEGSTNIPYQAKGTQGKPFRYLGRKMPLADWQKNDSNAEYLEKLTAIGYIDYGDPTFAAFYPNCHSVFGFYDHDYASDLPDGLQYDVIGWYSQTQQDYLNTFVKTTTQKDLLTAIKEEFQWAVSLEANQECPDEILCYASLTFGRGEEATENEAVVITVGNTGTEALSAYLAKTIDSNDKLIIEEQLEALHLSTRLENQQLDTGAKFKEALHEKSFAAIPGVFLWTVIPKTEATSANAIDANAQTQITLPENIAEGLNTLNCCQQDYDRALDEIESQRKQLFSDWYKYMLCTYPPEAARDDYPDIDEVKHYIEVERIAPLQQKIATTGNLTLYTDLDGKVVPAAADSAPTSLANELATAINQLQIAIATYNQRESVKQAKTTYILKPIPSPRYWQPNEPVVLMTGDAVKPTPRHGQDGRLTAEGLLECQVLANASIKTLIPQQFQIVREKIDALEKELNGNSITFNTWTQPPWHPLLLEWEVEIFPTSSQSNLDIEDRNYKQDFITSNYTLTDNEPDLSLNAGKGAIAKAANIYSGSSILTPHAGIQLKDKLEAYLNQQLLPAYYEAEKIPQEKEKQNPTYLDKHIDVIQTWYETIQAAALDTAEKKAQDPIYTAIRAFQELATLNSLSQSLGGFNEGLLMHKQTMQLKIADPLGFDDYQQFTDAVRDAVQDSIKSAPAPLNDFNPIRSGVMKILRLRLIDTFGEVKELDVSNIITTESMTAPERPDLVSLPPRLVQPACLNFRWLSASHNEQEMNAAPATTPICGWLLPNHLDNSLVIYNNQGEPLGSINRLARWEYAPGNNGLIDVDDIPNIHLQKMVRYLTSRGANFLNNFISVLDTALANIEPENYEQHQGIALLIGRPIALVRASLNLELQGLPTINQGWNVFRQDLRGNDGDTDGFTDVDFPIRIGESLQLNDGLVGYWQEAGDGYEGDLFYAPHPQSDENKDENEVEDAYIKKGSFNLRQSLAAPPQILSMLLDPRGKVHATTGILPTKAIDIPPEQYVAALQAIKITFLTAPILSTPILNAPILNAPILSDLDKINLPLPTEPGYAWSWLKKTDGIWSEISSDKIGQVKTEATFSAKQEIHEGWLKLSQNDDLPK